MKRFMGAEAIVEKKRQYIMPCLGHFYKNPPQFVKGEMQYLFDSEGKKYLDCYAGVSVINCGHCNPAIVEPMIEQMRELLEVFADALVTQRSFFGFVYYFDSFIKKEKVSADRLAEYEKTISSTNEIVLNALQKGIADGTISFSGSKNEVLSQSSVQELFATMMHSLFCLAQKLSISGDLLAMDKSVEARKQIEILINILLEAMRTEK